MATRRWRNRAIDLIHEEEEEEDEEEEEEKDDDDDDDDDDGRFLCEWECKQLKEIKIIGRFLYWWCQGKWMNKKQLLGWKIILK